MTYGVGEIAWIAAVMTLGSVVQGAVGFASGMIGVPLLVLGGFSLAESATINLVSTSVQNLSGAWKLWSHLDPRELPFPVLVRWLTIPLGVYAALQADSELTPAQLKQLVGLFLLGVVSLLWGFRIRPRDRLAKPWQALAFSTSGFLMGFAAIGGAPMVVFVNSLTWSAAKSRAFLFFCSASSLPVALVAYGFQHGRKVLPAAMITVAIMPVILVGLSVGLRMGHRLSKRLFRRITFSLLLVLALGSILAPLLR